MVAEEGCQCHAKCGARRAKSLSVEQKTHLEEGTWYLLGRIKA